MGNPMGSQKFESNPEVMKRVTDMDAFGNDRGPAGRANDAVLEQMMNGGTQLGYGTGAIGGVLNPIREQGAVDRESMRRSMQMGGNRLFGSSQPALMAAMGNAADAEINRNTGLNFSKALPALFTGASQGSQDASNMQLQAKNAAIQGATGGNPMVKREGWLMPLIGSVAGGVGSAMGGRPG